MHRRLRLRRRRRDDRGAVAIVVALLMTTLLVITALVLDFGLVRIDRQIDRSAADAATLAGLHGLNLGDGSPHPYAGVCTAVRYLKANSERFSTASESTGWSNGLGAATGNGCSDVALRNKTCKPTDKTTWAKWAWGPVTSRGVTVTVTIESGYDLAANNQWGEDSLPATSGDNGASAYQGCDNLAVTISQSREPGLGSLATDSDLETAIRSVGRIKAVPGGAAPAMLLLKRTGCPVLTTGASGGSSYVHVLGALTSDGRNQPGTIHADTDGVGCNGGNNSWVYGGLANTGIVAYAAPTVGNPTVPDASKPGSITSTAVLNGLSGSIIRDSLNYVYGSSALNGTGGTKVEVTGRSLVTRSLVDDRYFTGVKAAVSGASSVFASGASGAPASGFNKVLTGPDACKPNAAQVTALNLGPSDNLYINCDGKFVGDNAGNIINAGAVYFRGWVNPASTLKLPNAHHVYIGNHGDNADAISIGNNASFEVNNQVVNLDPTSGNCSTGQSASKSLLSVRTGTFKQTGGLLRMCRTTTVMMGGQTTGCVPATAGIPPTTTPCGGGLGTGQFSQNGGGIDWTAPDTLDATIGPDGVSLATAVAAWQDANGPEDLALWSESATSPSTGYNMAGGGVFQVRGVFMVPNADSFVLSGGASLNLTNAQFIASSIQLNGNTTNVTMSVDPNTAISLPDQGLVGLVR